MARFDPSIFNFRINPIAGLDSEVGKVLNLSFSCFNSFNQNFISEREIKDIWCFQKMWNNTNLVPKSALISNLVASASFQSRNIILKCCNSERLLKPLICRCGTLKTPSQIDVAPWCYEWDWIGLDISGHVVDVRCGGCGEWETGYSHQFFSGLFYYILCFAKNTANICGNFCAPQKILQIFVVAIFVSPFPHFFAVNLRSAPTPLGRSQAGP